MDECVALFSLPFVAEGQEPQEGFPSTIRILFQPHAFGFGNLFPYQPPLFARVNSPGAPPCLHIVPVVINIQNLGVVSLVVLGEAEE